MIAHPHYSTGEPILLGDQFNYPSHHDVVLVVGEIKYIRHYDEVWVSRVDKTFGLGCEVFYPDRMTLVARAAAPSTSDAAPATCRHCYRNIFKYRLPPSSELYGQWRHVNVKIDEQHVPEPA